jgi:transaldolase/transaldolase/glucose-6-phosphate isomerase
MMMNPLVRLGELGQSPWYDYITRDLVASGELARLIREDGLRGMTSNPTIFEKAVSGSRLYDDDIRRLGREGRSAGEIFEALAVADVRAACDVFAELHRGTGGLDGQVSLEVSPALAGDPIATVREAERLWAALDRPNAMIKIPGTEACLPAIAQCVADGISVNVTLLFSVERYAAVIEAWLTGMERRLDRAGASEPSPLRGRIAMANAAAAYRLFEWSLGTPRWDRLAKAGARPQRPLWASTSTKDPRYPDTYYVEALVAPRTVNTLPPETFAAYRDHGRPAVRIREGIAKAPEQMKALAGAGIDLAAITRELEEDGVAKFAASYQSLLTGIESKAGELVGR